jgi:hypothetical protein
MGVAGRGGEGGAGGVGVAGWGAGAGFFFDCFFVFAEEVVVAGLAWLGVGAARHRARARGSRASGPERMG